MGGTGNVRTPKAILHEWATKSKARLDFQFDRKEEPQESGPHKQTYTYELSIDDGYTNMGKVHALKATGEARLKKAAEQAACQDALDQLTELGHLNEEFMQHSNKRDVGGIGGSVVRPAA